MAFSAPDGYGVEVSKCGGGTFDRVCWRTYAELDWDGEEVAASFLCNFIAARNTWKIDECRLHDAFFSLYRPHETFGEARFC
jgi:hypothetical protein